ncbi:hypothetical protein AB6H18_18940 [Enterobacter hormaechei]
MLEDAYISSQRNHLETVASALDRQLQFSVDKMLLFRHSMHDALETPLAFGALHDAVKRFAHLRTSPTWQIAVDKRRTLPINGVSDAFVEKTTLLNRDDEYLDNELSAALEVGYLLRSGIQPFPQRRARDLCLSRGFLLETDTPENQIVQRYYHLVTQPWFTQQSERENRARAVRWFISPPSSFVGKKPLITASVPVYYHHVWYGVVVAMDFTFATLHGLLVEAVGDNPEGEYQLYDSRLTLLATSESPAVDVNHFDARRTSPNSARDRMGFRRRHSSGESFCQLGAS